MTGETSFVARGQLTPWNRLVLFGLPLILWIQSAYYLGWFATWGIRPETDNTHPVSNVIALVFVIGTTLVFFLGLWRAKMPRLRMDAQNFRWTPPLSKARQYRWDEIDRITVAHRNLGMRIAEEMTGEDQPRTTYAMWLKNPLPGLAARASRRTHAGDFVFTGAKTDRGEAELAAALRHFAGDKLKP